MKTVDYELGGKQFHLCMNGAALLDCYDKFGNKGSIIDCIKGNGKKAFENTCFMLYKFAEQGELVRRYQGFKISVIPTVDYFQTMLKPLDIVVAKRACEEAIRLGFLREEDADAGKEIDIGLQEIEKKTETD